MTSKVVTRQVVTRKVVTRKDVTRTASPAAWQRPLHHCAAIAGNVVTRPHGASANLLVSTQGTLRFSHIVDYSSYRPLGQPFDIGSRHR
jgi:hypothetical protein